MKRLRESKEIVVLFIVVCLLMPAGLFAESYYIDASGGNDENIGTSPSAAWQTIQKVNTSSFHFQPGDTILFKCGETWHERLYVPASGNTLNPVTVTSYGTDCATSPKPAVMASKPVTGWTLYSGNIYVAEAGLMATPYNYIINNSFDLNKKYWTHWSTNGDATLVFQQDCSQTGGCLKFTSGAQSTDNHMSSNQFSVEAGRTYRVSFKISADQVIPNVRFLVRKAAPGWEDLGLYETITVGTEWSDLSYDFIATQTIDIARFDLYIPDGQVSIYLDNISVMSLSDEPATVKQVFADGEYLKLAQYQNSGYLTIDQNSTTKTYLVDSELGLLPQEYQNDLAGAGIHIRTINWFIEDRQVSGYVAAENKLSWNTPTRYTIAANFGYYLDNKLWMLDQPGEWYYDENTDSLYIWLSDSTDPSDHVIEASLYDTGIEVTLRSNVIIENMAVFHAANDGIALNDSPDCTIRDVHIADSGRNGLYFYYSPSGTIESSVLENSVNQGIYADQSNGMSIVDNLIEKSGVVGSPKNSLAAISMRYSDGAQIYRNRVLDSGYNGIVFLRDTSVINNVIERSCKVLDDCGGIYTWNGNTPSTPYNSVVTGNIVIDSIGNIDGTPSSQPNAKGIYLDNFAHTVTVTGNTALYASSAGLNLHNALNITADGNTLYGNLNYQLTLKETGSSSHNGAMQNNTLTNNILFSHNDHEQAGLWGDYGNIDLGYFDLNTYSLLYTDIIVAERLKTNPSVNKYDISLYTPAEWSQKGMGPIAFSPFQILPARVLSIDSVNFITNSTFDTSIAPWGGWSTNGDAEWTFEQECNATGGCLKFTSGASSSDNHITSNQFSLESGHTYMVEFNAASAGDVTVPFIVRKAEGPLWESVGLNKDIKVNDFWQHYQYVFTADQTLNNARLDFYLPQGQDILYLDEVHVAAVTAEFNDPWDDAQILINKEANEQEMPCPDNEEPERCGQYIDLDEQPVTWPVTLAPYSSKIIVWEYNPFMKCTDIDLDGYSQEGRICGLIDPDDSDALIVPISDLYAYPHGNNTKIRLEWTCTPSAAGYNIYRGSQSGGPYEKIKSNYQTTGCSFNDTQVAGGNIYYYVIRFLDANGAEAPESNEAHAALP